MAYPYHHFQSTDHCQGTACHQVQLEPNCRLLTQSLCQPEHQHAVKIPAISSMVYIYIYIPYSERDFTFRFHRARGFGCSWQAGAVLGKMGATPGEKVYAKISQGLHVTDSRRISKNFLKIPKIL